MIELFFNEFLSTFPFHILACVPFHKNSAILRGNFSLGLWIRTGLSASVSVPDSKRFVQCMGAIPRAPLAFGVLLTLDGMTPRSE